MNWIEGLIIFVIVLLVGATTVTIVTQTRLQKQCLELGYKEVSFDYTLEGYCIKRVDQTDVVVPLKDLIN